MDKAVLYVHGKGGDASEAGQFAKNCPGFAVIGASYDGEHPWNAVKQIAAAFDGLAREYQQVSVIANSIGAYLSMIALQNRRIGKALFISPVLDMEKLILGMMEQADVTEAELRERGEIPTESGETLSWRYLCFVRENPIVWNIPTAVLYAERDVLTSRETVDAFVKAQGASLTVMENGEHWFHTAGQRAFLDGWMRREIM